LAKSENEVTARQLAYIGSISNDAISTSDLSIFLIKDLLKNYKKEFCGRYDLTDEEIDGKEAYEILEIIGIRRKFLVKGGEIDYDRTALAVIDDFRKGRIGRITF
jgi:ribosome biogenesis GTPase A